MPDQGLSLLGPWLGDCCASYFMIVHIIFLELRRREVPIKGAEVIWAQFFV